MLVSCVNYWYIFWPGQANTRTATWTFSSFCLNMIPACASALPATAMYKKTLYMILACASVLPVTAIHSWSSYVNMILAGASVLPLTAIRKNSLYMILACVAKCWSHPWIIGIFFGQDRPTHEQQQHGLSAFLPQYDSGLCVCAISDINVQENPIHDSGLCGQKVVLCMNYWYIFWPG